jgi:hypothetical protein
MRRFASEGSGSGSHAQQGPHETEFVAFRARNVGEFFVPFTVDKVFPLYGPVEEAKWAPGWNPQWLYPERSAAEASLPERGWVFTTGKSSSEKRLWSLQKADFTLYEISYLVHWPERMVYTIDICSEPFVDSKEMRNGTRTTVKYDFIGTSVEGNSEVEGRSGRPEHYLEEMKHWRQLIQGYLERSSR